MSCLKDGALMLALGIAASCASPPPPACGADGVVNGDGVNFTIAEATDVDRLAGCTTINVHLTIIEPPPRFFLYDQPAPLTSLAGLESLTSVEGSVTVFSTTLLEDLRGLDGLTRIGGGLIIEGNVALGSLAGLGALTTVGDACDGFCGRLHIAGNPALRDLDGLSSLSTLGGDLVLLENALLTDLGGLSSLTTIHGAVQLSGAQLTNVGLPALTTLDGALAVIGVGATTLAGLDALELAGEVRINGNPNLTSLEGLGALRTTGRLEVSGNPNLDDLTGLDSLTNVTGDVVLTEFFFTLSGPAPAPSLTSLDGLETLTTVGGTLIVEETSITNVRGLRGLESVAGNLSITSVSFRSSSTCGFTFDALPTLDGLEALRFVGGDLVVACHDALGDIRALGGIEELGGAAVISNNRVLPQCQVDLVVAEIGASCSCTANDGSGVCP